MNPFSTIYATAPGGASCVKSFLSFLQTQSYPRPEALLKLHLLQASQLLLVPARTRKHECVFHLQLSSASNQTATARSCLHACRECRERRFEGCSSRATAASRRKAHPCTDHALFVSSQRSFVHPLLSCLSAFTIEYIFSLRHTHSAIGVPAHSSFILPKTFLLVFECSGWSFG